MPHETLIGLLLVAIGAPLLWLIALLLAIHLFHRMYGRPVLWIGLRRLAGLPGAIGKEIRAVVRDDVEDIASGLGWAVHRLVRLPGMACETVMLAPDYLALLCADLWGALRGRASPETDAPEDDPEPAPDPAPTSLEAARQCLDLPAAFTEAMFKTAYRTAMKHAHPDLGGSVAAAQAVAAAAAVIRRHKGWR